MRIILVLACLAALGAAGCGEDDEQAATTGTLADLTITVDPDGSRGAKDANTATVQCASAQDSKLCGIVSNLKGDVFEPTPGNVACTEQYGGPQTAAVKGTLHGEAIDAKFSRVNGCEISRWEQAAPLLEAAG